MREFSSIIEKLVPKSTLVHVAKCSFATEYSSLFNWFHFIAF